MTSSVGEGGIPLSKAAQEVNPAPPETSSASFELASSTKDASSLPSDEFNSSFQVTTLPQGDTNAAASSISSLPSVEPTPVSPSSYDDENSSDLIVIEEVVVIEEILDTDDEDDGKKACEEKDSQHPRPLTFVSSSQTSDSSFFTADSSPSTNADERLSAFLSENDSTIDDDRSSVVSVSPLQIPQPATLPKQSYESLSSQEFMSRIASSKSNTPRKVSTEGNAEESHYATAPSSVEPSANSSTRTSQTFVSLPAASPTASFNIFRNETSRLRSLSQVNEKCMKPKILQLSSTCLALIRLVAFTYSFLPY